MAHWCKDPLSGWIRKAEKRLRMTNDWRQSCEDSGTTEQSWLRILEFDRKLVGWCRQEAPVVSDVNKKGPWTQEKMKAMWTAFMNFLMAEGPKEPGQTIILKKPYRDMYLRASEEVSKIARWLAEAPIREKAGRLKYEQTMAKKRQERQDARAKAAAGMTGIEGGVSASG